MNWILNRFKERSTWSALITLVGIVGVNLQPELQEQIITAALAIVSVIFAFTTDPPKAADIAQEVVNATAGVSSVPAGGSGQTITSPPLTDEQRNALSS
jgi:hypothetical protein